MNYNLTSDSKKGILQMDIEGTEYEVILSTSTENLLKFQCLIIEFHNLHQIQNDIGYQIIYSCF